jgi:hypothetical protein
MVYLDYGAMRAEWFSRCQASLNPVKTRCPLHRFPLLLDSFLVSLGPKNLSSVSQTFLHPGGLPEAGCLNVCLHSEVDVVHLALCVVTRLPWTPSPFSCSFHLSLLPRPLHSLYPCVF